MTRRPAEVWPPCEFILTGMMARWWGVLDLEDHTEWTREQVNEIIDGKQRITPAIAATLAQVFGTGAEYWLNLQAAWDNWNETP